MTELAKPPARRWLLIASLGLNLFLIGFMAIGIARHHWGDDHHPRQFREMMHFMRDGERSEHFLRHIPDADTAAIQSLKMQHGAEFSAAWAESRAARHALREMMSNGERDPVRLAPAFERLAVARQRYARALQDIVIEAAQDLSDEGYKAFSGASRP